MTDKGIGCIRAGETPPAPPARAIGPELDHSPDTIKVLLAVIQGMFSEMLSGDAMALAFYRARKTARDNGVSDEEFNRVGRILVKEWQKKRGANPLSGMF